MGLDIEHDYAGWLRTAEKECSRLEKENKDLKNAIYDYKNAVVQLQNEIVELKMKDRLNSLERELLNRFYFPNTIISKDKELYVLTTRPFCQFNIADEELAKEIMKLVEVQENE